MTHINEVYRAEGWGLIAETALGIPPNEVESMAREVARHAHKEIERLIRERDEARAGNHAYNEYEPTWAELVDAWKQRAAEAHAAGYRKGVEDALDKVRKEKVSFKSEGYAGGIEGARGEIFACTCCEEEISALLEQTGEANAVRKK